MLLSTILNIGCAYIRVMHLCIITYLNLPFIQALVSTHNVRIVDFMNSPCISNLLPNQNMILMIFVFLCWDSFFHVMGVKRK